MPSPYFPDDDEQIIADLLKRMRRLEARQATTRVRGTHDEFTVAATPETTFPLTYIPVDGTCAMYVNGLEQEEGTDYTVDYDTGLVTFVTGLTTGDQINFRYLVTDWLVARSLPADTGGFSDTFNRANGSLGVADSGQTWQVLSGSWSIVSNQATSGGGGVIAVIDSGSADGTLTLDYVTARGGVCFRASDASNYYGVERDGIFKVVAGVPTSIIFSFPGISPGQTITVTMSGDNFDVYATGLGGGHASFTDSFNNTATKHGLYADNSSVALDNISFVS